MVDTAPPLPPLPPFLLFFLLSSPPLNTAYIHYIACIEHIFTHDIFTNVHCRLFCSQLTKTFCSEWQSMMRHSRERWAAKTVMRRGASPAALVLVMVVMVVRVVRVVIVVIVVMVVNMARVGGDVRSQLLVSTVRLSLQLSVSVKVRAPYLS